MTRRSPFLVYLLLFITLGLFGLIWFFQVMRFLNSLHPSYVYRIRRIGWLVGLFIFVYLIGQVAASITVSSGAAQRPWAIGMFMIIMLLALAWNVFVQIAVVPARFTPGSSSRVSV